MESIVHDLLLFVSLVVAPIILGFLLYLGLHISDHDAPLPSHRGKGEQKHPERLRP